MKTMTDHYHEELSRGNPETWRLLKERALESTAEGIVISDCTQPDTPIIYVNNAFTEITGYTYDEVVGKNCRFLQGQDSDPAAAEQIRKAVSEQQPCRVEILNYRKDGTPFWNSLSVTPVRDDQGHVTHFIGIQSDVTRRRKAEESLRNANTQLKRDLQAAAAIQQAQLPKALPEIDGFQFGWRYQPCQELAGDTLNIIQLDDDHVAVYVLDVCGHGVRAALHSFSLAQDLRPRQGGPDLNSPEHVVERLNLKYPMNAETGMFFTILYGVLGIRNAQLNFVSAGHPGPVLMRSGREPEVITTSSFPIGVADKPEYETHLVKLNSGDKLILYTDGVVEALSSRNIAFSEKRFLKALKRTSDQPIERCLDAVMKSLENWACHVKLRDDLSLIGIQATS